MIITIPLNPVGKKNNQQILRGKDGRPFIAQSQRYKNFEKDCLWYLPKLEKPIDYPINLKVLFYRDNRRRVDRVNLEEAIQDVLVVGGILADDNRDICASGDGSRVLYDKDNPRIEIYIEPLKEKGYEQWSKKGNTKS